MCTQENSGPHSRDTASKYEPHLHDSMHFHIRFTYALENIARFASAPGKWKKWSVRTALVFYNWGGTQWIFCTWLSQFISIRIISSFAQKWWHMWAMLMNLVLGRRQRAAGLVVSFKKSFIWPIFAGSLFIQYFGQAAHVPVACNRQNV